MYNYEFLDTYDSENTDAVVSGCTGPENSPENSDESGSESKEGTYKLHNNVFAHGTVTNLKGWRKLTPIQSLLTLSTPLGAPARISPCRTRSYPQPS